MKKEDRKTKPLASGHGACAGCGEMIAIRAALNGMGENTIIANATGCTEVTTTRYPTSSWKNPWIHSLFENASSVASGIKASLDYKSKKDKTKKKTKVVVQGGDGATFDIGIGLISGMWERGENILYITYDSEVYSNTGVQASGATPWAASTTTTPAGSGKGINAMGSIQRKKDMITIALAHRLNYVAQSTSAFPDDITRKVKKALETDGPSYIQILTPCIPGWKIQSNATVKVARLAVQTGLYPLLEYVNGKLIKSSKIGKKTKVDEYLELQGRFSHLTKTALGKKQIKYIQSIANKNIKEYNL